VAAIDKDHARLEAIFHQFSLDQPAAAAQCLALDLELDKDRSADSRRVLLMNLLELIDFGRSLESGPSRGDTTTLPPPTDPTIERPRIHPKAERRHFDVFLCHHSQDKPEVEAIGVELRKRNLQPWLDRWELRPGRPWQQSLEDQIETIGSAAVFVGSSGLGPWQDIELQAFLRQFRSRDCPVIPVILPTVTTIPRLPTFLAGMTWVDFRDTESQPFSMLIWGITGERPPDLR